MATDLSDLIPYLLDELAPPGQGADAFPDADDQTWLRYLQSAFWSARLDGLLKGYTEEDGMASPDLPRDFQQIVVLYAAISVVSNQMLATQTAFRAKAGPVEYEEERSATLLRALLDELIRRRNLILERLGDLGQVESYYIDAVFERSDSIRHRDTYWAL